MKSKLEQWMLDHWHVKEALTRQQVEQEQLSKINQLLAHAKQYSSFYHYLPNRIESLDEIKQIPLISGEDVALYGHKMVCVSQSEIQRIVTMKTSGTTGRPKRIYFTQEDQEVTIQFFVYGLSELISSGDVMLILMPCIKEGSIGQLVSEALRRIGAKAILCGPEKTFKEMTDLIECYQANTIVGSPLQLLSLARYMQNQRRLFPIERVLVSSDYLPNGYEEILGEIWGCVVYNHYGSTESGLGFAIECEKHEGMHIREWDILAEIINPKTGEVLPDGQWGELVFTTLSTRGMPLIRYRTGDRTRIRSRSCSCGSVVKSIDLITGRIAPDGENNDLLHWLDDRLFTLKQLIDYRLVYDATEQLFIMEVILATEDVHKYVHWIVEQWNQGLGKNYILSLKVNQSQSEQWRSLYRGKRKILME